MSLSPEANRPSAVGYDLPASLFAAMLRGVRHRCPRCGEGKLFRRWLKPVDTCSACSLDISGQRADDLPAYIGIFVTGHLLAPVIIALVTKWELGALALLAIIIPLAIVMLVALLQPSKGAVIGLQWWNGMHGFRKERLPEREGLQE
ncbi:DUF983 domain-containing protein [Qipengyuania gaetbuli]|uniref:DUF983 domain-containing protein n=1 Tax=Qipengyuania gaetbuli TaxID=266952 RepID=UPI001C993DE5|nr:DUF983 domain-containing protein [Qipengyuania gaetbuli]MBY6016137.1 DUF983 domain-containing protein [Qipengyuania gaetbuli]